MKELNDKDFDQAFKTRITEEYPEFEEESWLKMEKKLKKRDRLVFYRNASIILLFLSFGLGFYLINRKIESKADVIAVKKQENKKVEGLDGKSNPIGKEETKIADNGNNDLANSNGKSVKYFNPSKTFHYNIITNPLISQTSITKKADSSSTQKAFAIVKPQEAVNAPQQQIINKVEAPTIAQATPEITPVDESDIRGPKAIRDIKIKRKIPFSLAISVGPDFNSTNSIVGGKSSLALGVGVGVGLTKKLSVQTGLIYGSKNYTANGYNYTFNNPNIAATITQINAACKVLEIPLRASYNISDNQKRSIELNAGLSSYLMLKENYVFKYTAASGRKDRISEKINENQHFLSVIDLSATYNIKLKNKKLGFGIEPYVKIPLSGIGEGNVPLKSSGVSLKLRYDFNKK
ncbi:outer membrane beta-barrel protein [Pedobacter sp. LMG 31464]|uniref:Outer membrane beta-barrel protein n=1 Tax=Pedobacter planticolens TaxID=2679964 RepID=A0A923DYY2_9SPHI|nr:outer membrane beta-barrel protein [Pedobacter planticolens]MBB2146631.1 outer membrane beta-barrel protein [Pedobacter planticolens]